MKKLLLSAAAVLFFIGCGSSSGGGDELKTASATYVDAPVAGIEYQCGGVSGVTDNLGGFIYEEGKDCVFRVGGIAFKTIKSYELEEGKVIMENSSAIAALLQTLDIDGDPSNGITISAEENKLLANYSLSSIDDTAIENLYEKLKTLPTYKGKYYTKTEALLNLIHSQTQMVKDTLANKTLYYVKSSDEVEEGYITINADANETNIDGVVNMGFSINGTVVNFEDNTTAVLNLYNDRVTLTYLYDNLPVKSLELFYSKTQADNFANELKSGEYLKKLIAGKVFYQVFQDSDGNLILNQVQINSDASAGLFHAVDGTKFGGTFSIKISGNKLYLHIDGVNIDYSVEYLGKSDEMLIFAPSEQNVNIASYMFFDENYAKNILALLQNN
ncbi:hypothetical protein [Caminibacter pacificus]|jgi:hypothetical protein